MIYCLFEQSGTFKKCFKELGCDVVDVDIENNFNETDMQVDLFDQIDRAYHHISSIFDDIGEDDLVIAFYPCTCFSSAYQFILRQDNYGMKGKSELEKIADGIIAFDKLVDFYKLFLRFCYVLEERHIKAIIENPYHASLLKILSPVRPALIDLDRRRLGDDMIKPTQYFFINTTPAKEMEMHSKRGSTPNKRIEHLYGFMRSEINPTYAKNFIKEYIRSEDYGKNKE